MAIDPSIILGVQPPQPIADPMKLAQQRMALQNIGQQQQLNDVSLASEKAKLQAQQQSARNDQVLAQAYNQSIGPDGKVDRTKLESSLATLGMGAHIPLITKTLDEADEANAKAIKARTDAKESAAKADVAETDYAKTLGLQMKAADYNPAIVNGLFAVATQHGHDVKPFEDLFNQNPDGFKTFVDKLTAPKEQGFVLGAGQTRYEMGPDGNPIAVASVPTAAPKLTYGAPQTVLLDGKPGLVRAGSDGAMYDMANKPINSSSLAPKPEAATGNAQVEQSNAHKVALGIKNGTITPTLLESTRGTAQGMALGAELEDLGVDSNKILRDWIAAKHAIGSLNGEKQILLAQNINKASESLNKIDELNAEWSKNSTRWGWKTLNKASLAAAKNGVYGQEAASVAQRLEGQIADVTGTIGQVIMGGGSPTDAAFELAGKNLSADWNENVLRDSVKQVRYNLNLAQNARNEMLQQVGVTSTQQQTPPAVAPPAQGQPPKAPAGWKYVPKSGGGWTAVPDTSK